MRSAPGIFLAEDSPADVYLIKEALKAHGVDSDVIVVPDGEAALAVLKQQDGPVPLLFILDLNLPKVDGLEILRRVRATPRFAATRVLILTGSTNPSDRDRALALGANGYIEKAVAIDDFLKIGRQIKKLLWSI